jgi:predicted nucleic acid-binding protein
MRAFFIDTNVLLDFLADRKPFSDQAEIIFEYQQKKKIKIFVSAISFNNLYYIISKIDGHKAAITLLDELVELVIILPLDRAIIQQALKSSFADFEDAIQNFTALHAKNIEGIVTRNVKDFRKSDLAILSPELAIKLIEE